MYVFFRKVGRGLALAMLVSLLLASCHRGSSKDTATDNTAQLQSKFDATVQAYKDGQFLMDGAVLSATDLSGHFSYLKEQGHLPKTILLTNSDDTKIHKQHLQYMARLQLDFGFVVYYDRKGELVKIDPVETKARELEDYRPNHTAPSSDDSKPQQGGGGNPPGQ